MATQGIVSIVDKKTKKVLFKIVAGCDGYNASKVSDLLSACPKDNMKISTVLQASKDAGFGCDECLVVMDSVSSVGADDELPERYRRTFSDPKFNPRWDRGTAAYLEIIYT